MGSAIERAEGPPFLDFGQATGTIIHIAPRKFACERLSFALPMHKNACVFQGARRASSARHARLEVLTVGGGTAIHQLAQRRDCYRSQRGTRDVVDFSQDLAQGPLFTRCIAGGGSLVNGGQVFEQLHDIQQGGAPRIAGKLKSAPCTADRADEAGASQDVHDFRQVMTGHTVFLANLGDGKVPAIARRQFQDGEDRQSGRNLQSHDVAASMRRRSEKQLLPNRFNRAPSRAGCRVLPSCPHCGRRAWEDEPLSQPSFASC